MKKNKNSIVSFFVLIALVALFLSIFFGKIITNPNSFLLNNTGDAIKNYYTYAYFINDNKSNTNFEGMNYPYGENYMYTDCHPVLASSLKFLQQYFPNVSNYSIGILNFLLIISIAITAIVIYFIFIELNINLILAILGAIGITVLSPQILRITGHYALSYSFAIPLIIYLLLKFEENIKRKKIVFLLTISIIFFFSIHAYLGMIASTTFFTYTIISLINHYIADKKINFRKHLMLFLSSAFPIVIYFLFVKITDIHTGRTTNPWGILECHADPRTIFLPVAGPLNKLKDYFFPGIHQTWEGWAYIGFSTILMLLFYFWVSIKSSIKAKKIMLDKTWIDNLPLRNLLIASLFILAFSMFLPFYFNMERLINYFNIIKQFRAIGRFAWVFYFMSTITLIYILNVAFQKLLMRKRNLIAYVLIVIVPLSLFVEGKDYYKNMQEEISQKPNLFDIKQTSKIFREDITAINPNKYEAIIPFPFFYIGSENFGKVATDESIYKISFLFSYHLKLPIIGSYLTRTSIYESKKIMQLFASNFYHKLIQSDLPKSKPYLVICLNNNLSDVELNYLKKAKLIVKRNEYSIYEINIETFFENSAVKEFEEFNKIKNQLFEKKGFLVSDTSLYFSFIDFKNPNSDISFSGDNGCYSGFQKDYNKIFSIEKGSLKLNKKYTARFWMYNYGENYGQDCLGGTIFFLKRKGDQVEWLNPFANAGSSSEINDKWSLVEISFDHTDADASYELQLKGSDISEKTFYLDNLLFYDNDLEIYKVLKSKNKITLFKNNHRIEIPN